jgi:hypothetical protein
MIWRADWNAIAARIDALVDGSRFLLDAFKAAGSDCDAHGCVPHCIVPEARGIICELAIFHLHYKEKLPAAALSLLQGFLERADGIVPDANSGADLQPIVWFQLFRSQFEYTLRDSEASVSALTERAFQHLQRLIVADTVVRDRWQDAFGQTRAEERCEKLGGAHLLHHGIFGFKIRGSGDAPGSGEVTDLVFQEPVRDVDGISRIADGLVLTEWKCVTAKNIDIKTEDAIVQAELYRGGVLGGTELRRTRYVVVVSRDFLPPPFQKELGVAAYRRISIRVAPKPASVSARKRS